MPAVWDEQVLARPAHAELRDPQLDGCGSAVVADDDWRLCSRTSRKLATRIRKEVPGNARKQIARAWRILFGMEPQEAEVTRSLMYLAEQTETLRSYFASKPPAKNAPPTDAMIEALGSYCQVLFSSNRFLYIE